MTESARRAATTPRTRVNLKLRGAIAVAAVTLGYVLLWWNRSFGMGCDGVLFLLWSGCWTGKSRTAIST